VAHQSNTYVGEPEGWSTQWCTDRAGETRDFVASVITGHESASGHISDLPRIG
jgi:hypothetical protein